MAPPDALSPDAIAARVARWRPMPAAVMSLLTIHESDPAATERLVEVVRQHAELDRWMRIIGLRSQKPGAPARDNVGAAARELGYRAVHSVALATLLLDALAADARNFDFMDYWRRASACGSIIASLAGAERSPARDLAYTAGLLSQVGLLALDMTEPEALSRLQDAVIDEGWSEPLEEAILGFTIRDLTAALLVRWRLPVELPEAHLVLGQPELWATRPVARLLALSLQTVDALGLADPLRGAVGGATVPSEVARMLTRYYGGPPGLLAMSDGFLANCLVAREEPSPEVPAESPSR